MADTKLPISPIMFPARDYGYAGGKDGVFPVTKIARTSHQNMVRNGAFNSWSQGTTADPDAWNASGAAATVDRTTTEIYWGSYAARVTKNTSDGDVTRLYQTVKTNPVLAQVYGKSLTFGILCKSDQADQTARVYVYDGSGYHYGMGYAGTGEWEFLWMNWQPTSGYTELEFGVEVAETASGSDVYYYLDCAMLVWGQYPAHFCEHPDDRSVICQNWHNNGTETPIRGAMRVEPFYEEITTVSGRVQTHTVTLPKGCKQIVHVSHNMRVTSYGNYYKLQIRAMTYTATSFVLNITASDFSSFSAGETFYIDGIIWMIGWDDEVEQWE